MFAAPHAALLIDFDNVTMGIRSDLTKELKTLLNSDIIRGKVTVQRAYADWRRYPQYIMPLTERSIDMIWATAVGSTKKNATDIRLAIDAIELVFTRPEIGTFIVLSGDSDFSSLVLKLKEYGKYVIGIGIRESASDLLIQNCDEYYSYSELAGLNRETDTPSVQRDAWELVTEALERMSKQSDVMRSDRLKQVMQQIDPNFDERNAGFNRFSKFVAEAHNRGLVQLTKLDNGQYEVAPPTAKPLAAPPARGEREGEPAERRGRGRGGRDRARREPAKDRGRPAGAAADQEKPRRPSHEAAAAGGGGLTLSAAFGLLTRALGELPSPARHDAVRARMAALYGREDPLLDSSRFGRLLHQANDAEIADVKKVGEDEYEVAMTRSSRARLGQMAAAPAAAPAAPASEPATPPSLPPTRRADETPIPAPEPSAVATSATLRFRRGSRGPARPPEIPLVGVVDITPRAAVVVAAPESPIAEKAPRRARGARKAPAPKKAAAEPAADREVAVAVAEPATAPKPREGVGRRGRGRSRGPRKPS